MVKRMVEVEIDDDCEDCELAVKAAFDSALIFPEDEGDTIKVCVSSGGEFIDVEAYAYVDVCNEIRAFGEQYIQYSMPERRSHPDSGIAPDAIAIVEPQLIKLEQAISYVRSLYNPNAKPVA